jgi:Protein of unknown function (DUF2808)
MIFKLFKRVRRPLLWLGFSILLITLPAWAIQIGDGTVFFARPPILDRAQASNRNTNVPGVVYSFTIEMPNNAGEPLHKLVFEQANGAESFRFDLNNVLAFSGRSRSSGKRQPATLQQEFDRLVMTFNPPILPGKTITVALPVIRNPSLSGTYFIGVTAIPQGEKVEEQFIGFGRFRIQKGGGS